MKKSRIADAIIGKLYNFFLLLLFHSRKYYGK